MPASPHSPAQEKLNHLLYLFAQKRSFRKSTEDSRHLLLVAQLQLVPTQHLLTPVQRMLRFGAPNQAH